MNTLDRNDGDRSLFGDGSRIDAALRKAYRRAVWEHKMLGRAICTWQDGKVVWIQPEDIRVEKPD